MHVYVWMFSDTVSKINTKKMGQSKPFISSINLFFEYFTLKFSNSRISQSYSLVPSIYNKR